MSMILSLGQTAFELGLICSLTVLALFLSYSMLNVCDLSTDGCFTLGAVVGASVAISGHPFLAIPASMLAGMLSGFTTALLQTKAGIDSLLAGIIVNTGLYSINIGIMHGSSLLNMHRTDTIFTLFKSQFPSLSSYTILLIALISVILVVLFLIFFLSTKFVGLCIANMFTGLSGCLLAQSQKFVDINIGQGMVTIALASLLIGRTLCNHGSIFKRSFACVCGAIVFRLVYTIALRFNMPAFMLKLVSSIIVILAIAIPYLKSQWPHIQRRIHYKRGL